MFVILGWATSTAALTLYTIFLGYLLPSLNAGAVLGLVIGPIPLPILIFYLGNIGICILAAVVISNTETTILSFFPSFIGSWIIAYAMLSLPDLLGCCGGVLELSAVSFTLAAFFPYLFLAELVGTFVGIGISGTVQ